jgi:hypothetical protein
MDPTQTIDGPFAGPDPADEEDLMQAFDDDDDDRFTQGPGEGDARVMAWARAM